MVDIDMRALFFVVRRVECLPGAATSAEGVGVEMKVLSSPSLSRFLSAAFPFWLPLCLSCLL